MSTRATQSNPERESPHTTSQVGLRTVRLTEPTEDLDDDNDVAIPQSTTAVAVRKEVK